MAEVPDAVRGRPRDALAALGLGASLAYAGLVLLALFIPLVALGGRM